MAGYEFGFLLEQSLGHVTHAKNLLTNVALDPEVHAHWGLIDFEATGIAGRIPVYRSNWTVRAGVRARREVARMNGQTKLDALFFHTQVPAILAQSWLRKIPGIVSLDATPLQYDELGAFYKHEQGPAWLEAWKWRLNRDCFRSARRLVAWAEWTKLGLVQDYEVPADKITVIPPGVNVHEWRRPTPRVPHANPVKILFVGGDLERKGGLVLLEAFRALRHLGLELHLVTKDRLRAGAGCIRLQQSRSQQPAAEGSLPYLRYLRPAHLRGRLADGALRGGRLWNGDHLHECGRRSPRLSATEKRA